MSTSSALSAFAKVFRPELEIYRCAASKMFEDVPYFPVAYLPVYWPKDPAAAAAVERAMKDDWTQTHYFARFKTPFAYRRRGFIAHFMYRLRGRLGILPVQKFMKGQK
jgi:hypothetical protein